MKVEYKKRKGYPGNGHAKRKFKNVKPAPVLTDAICAFFGCDKRLKSYELLMGDYCINHQREKAHRSNTRTKI